MNAAWTTALLGSVIAIGALGFASGEGEASPAHGAPESPTHAPQEDDAPELTDEELAVAIERNLRAATEGRPMIRSQAARRLMGLGPAADAAVLERAGETNAEFAALGRELIEACGISKDDELRRRLWKAADDRDFPWRPAAVSGLSLRPRAGELERFRPLLGDRLSSVRLVAANAWASLGGQARVLHPLLRDPEWKVRQQVAFLLAQAGDAGARWWLYEELERTDQFFDVPTGFQARLSATRIFRKLDQPLEGFDASREPGEEANAAALAAVREVITAKAGPRPQLPAVATAGGPVQGERVGISVRSCREGEQFLRWTDRDQLLVGQGNPAVVSLEEGTVAALVEAARQAHAGTEGQKLWGQPGCDLEQLHLVLAAGERPLTLNMMKGPEAVPELRPAALDPLAVLLVRSLPDAESEDPRLNRLRTRVAATLVAVGGPYE